MRTVLAMLEIPQEDEGHNEAELQLSHAQAQVQPQEQGKGLSAQELSTQGLSAQGLELKNVSLQYSSQHTALQDISLQLKPGEKIAVVGKTGAGKTSIAKVIDRLYPASSGSCMLDGISSEEMPLHEWRSRIAIVSQDPGVLTGTIRENLMLGLEKEPSKQAIERALAISDFQEAMVKENLSLDSALGEEGHNLSGGQRQRLQIARAVLRQPRYLILDEATANLDAKTEEKVLAALTDALPETGFLVISHRLATIVDSDRIYFIAQGKLLGSGTNEYLKSTFSQYRQLLALQGLDQD